MTPKDCQTLADVRQAIDALDRQIVPLLVARSTYVARAGQLKSQKDMVVDPARIEAVVAKARDLALSLGGNGAVIEDIYRKMIDAFITFETKEWESSHTP